MDIGCSSGFFLKLLKNRMPQANIVGSDYVRGPLEALAISMPDIPLVQFDLLNCPLPAASFDAVVLLNVFEHIENDVAAAKEVFRLLKPGGIAVIEVPAGPHLYDVYDRMLMHHRRYDMPSLLGMLRSVGFEIVERSHLGFLLYPGFYFVKKKNQRLLTADVALQRATVRKNISQAKNNPVFHTIMKLESGLRRWMYMPIGIRCLVTCKRPAPPN
jgi:SAM-dependent methyltransferase